MVTPGLEAGIEVARDPCDPRGWEARTLVDDRVAGRVRELLADDEGAVRWLTLELDGGRCVLLPAGQARVDRDRRRVWVPGFAADQLAFLPDHDPGRPLDAAREEALLTAYGAALLRERWQPAAPPPGGDTVVAAAAQPVSARPAAEDLRLDASTLFGAESA